MWCKITAQAEYYIFWDGKQKQWQHLIVPETQSQLPGLFKQLCSPSPVWRACSKRWQNQNSRGPEVLKPAALVSEQSGFALWSLKRQWALPNSALTVGQCWEQKRQAGQQHTLSQHISCARHLSKLFMNSFNSYDNIVVHIGRKGVQKLPQEYTPASKWKSLYLKPRLQTSVRIKNVPVTCPNGLGGNTPAHFPRHRRNRNKPKMQEHEWGWPAQ